MISSMHEVMNRYRIKRCLVKRTLQRENVSFYGGKKMENSYSLSRFINEIALVFLYGRPLKWTQSSKGTDRAFSRYIDLIKSTRFNAKVREAKRLAGAEGQSALLFHAYRNDEGKPDCLIKVVARSLGDDIYFRKDQFGRMMCFARGYNLQEVGGVKSNIMLIYIQRI